MRKRCGKNAGGKCGEKSGCRRSRVTTEALRARIWTRTSEPHIAFYEDSENRSPGADFGGFEVPNHDFSKNAVPHISRIFPALFPHCSRIFPAIPARIFPTCFPQAAPAFFPHFSRIWKSPMGASVALSHWRHNTWVPSVSIRLAVAHWHLFKC